MNIAQPVAETITCWRLYYLKKNSFIRFVRFFLLVTTATVNLEFFEVSRGFSIWACNDLLHFLNIPKSVVFELVIRIVHDILGATNNTISLSIPKELPYLQWPNLILDHLTLQIIILHGLKKRT